MTPNRRAVLRAAGITASGLAIGTGTSGASTTSQNDPEQVLPDIALANNSSEASKITVAIRDEDRGKRVYKRSFGLKGATASDREEGAKTRHEGRIDAEPEQAGRHEFVVETTEHTASGDIWLRESGIPVQETINIIITPDDEIIAGRLMG